MSVPDLCAALPRLQLVTDRRRGDAAAVAAAIQGGVAIVQVREKDLDDAAFLAYWDELRTAAAVTGEPAWILNNRPELAAAHGCGLHLPATAPGLSKAARAAIPLLGRSAHCREEVRRALDEDVDYLVLGTSFQTASKPGRAPLGLGGLSRLLQLAGSTPVFAIGGIDAARIPSVLRLGAHGVAVSGALLEAPDPNRAAEELLLQIATSVPTRFDHQRGPQ